MAKITRRRALIGLGTLVAAGCGGATSSDGAAGASPPAGGSPAPTPPAPPGPAPAPGPEPTPPKKDPTAEELLAGIDSIVVLMMENRSFDHFLGSLKTDATFANASKVEGLTGAESNPAPDGSTVKVFKMANFTPEDPPHGWDACHSQWSSGKNDGFVKAHAGASQSEVMGFHDRTQLPFYYWLADNFTVCDHWFASVLGPTWPNRFYLHSTSSKGKKDNTPFLTNAPLTLWHRMKDAGKTYKNYRAGAVAFYTGGYVASLAQMNPVQPMSEFWDDAKNGTLPSFAVIDPDFTASDDHPSHDVRRGQAFVASVYKAISESPQWGKTLLVITYDEHGGFFDHVAPPTTTDENPEFKQMGFRVPSFVIGGAVKKGFVNSTVFDHASVGATLRRRFGVADLSPRMAAANDLASCIDPVKLTAPAPPPTGMPQIDVTFEELVSKSVGTNSQPMLDELVARGVIPASEVDARPARERLTEWAHKAVELGAVRLR
ncbi:MAG: alkaline phosphatase family protein [Myxococcales bacterium]|nr:alkaline phosphatase family protein [Myxococcales bacterium]